VKGGDGSNGGGGDATLISSNVVAEEVIVTSGIKGSTTSSLGGSARFSVDTLTANIITLTKKDGAYLHSQYAGRHG